MRRRSTKCDGIGHTSWPHTDDRSTRRTLLVRIGAVASLVCAFGCSSDPGPHSARHGRAPPLSLPTLAGDMVELSSFRGRVVLLVFWASWSGPSKRLLRALTEIDARYRVSGLAVLAIAIDGPDTIAEVNSVVAREQVRFPVLLDADTRVVSAYDPHKTVPSMALVDREGRLVAFRGGFMPEDEPALRALIEEALGR